MNLLLRMSIWIYLTDTALKNVCPSHIKKNRKGKIITARNITKNNRFIILFMVIYYSNSFRIITIFNITNKAKLSTNF